ncbi:MAG: hypothetical protein CVU00_15100 [Bacteroidetes bacterium HGW-Bacteroidetes-17]|jgi:uncharacterized protein YdhG (YjbR/CyaY superfamily)|nr:MAG: hypothetical protein CVU00_15100 [Bacteroidetes bacterium HGW-Bacteroidetes-17]
MHSEAKNIAEYLCGLPEDRRDQISTVRKVILDNLPSGYEEVINWGMITYQVPLNKFPDTYNKQPMMYAALASQKNHMAVYLSGIYLDKKLSENFINEYKLSGKKMDIGKSCVRFKKIEQLPLEVIAKAISAFTADEYIIKYKALK